ncbi:MAG: hypothetical protein GDA56_12900 [Hormoscilla sp. GM7CHS1pb]|nr:hypothetical protein [Hormoscilla sp. GM7CHS1pb]
MINLGPDTNQNDLLTSFVHPLDAGYIGPDIITPQNRSISGVGVSQDIIDINDMLMPDTGESVLLDRDPSTDPITGQASAAVSNVLATEPAFNEALPDFDEAFYLAQYPDVAAVVAAGAFASGRDHYDRHGRSEGRLARFESESESGTTYDYDEVEIKLRTFIPDRQVGLEDLFDGSRLEDSWELLVNSGLINVPVGLVGTIPVVGPVVGYLVEDIVNRAETTFLLGDDRDFHYNDGTHRSKQKVVVTADPADRDGKVNDPVVEWGTFMADGPLTGGIIDIDIPDFLPLLPDRIQLGQLVDEEGTLTPTDDNNSVQVSRLSNNIVRTQLKLSGGIPLVPELLTPNIDADITVEIRQEEGEEAQYRISGSHDGFPAYELYINGERVYEHDPREAEKGPLDLFPPNDDVSIPNEDWQDVPRFFDEAFYLAQYPDVAAVVAAGAFASGRDHYDRHGRSEGRLGSRSGSETNEDFDEAFYLAQYPDVAAVVAAGAFASGRDHYDRHGRSEGRLGSRSGSETNEDFDEAFYLAQYPDVAAVVAAGAFASGRDHYDRHGRSEGRKPSARGLI